jgi:hypothetical protein
MAFSDVDQLTVNTIRVLAVGCCPSQQNEPRPRQTVAALRSLCPAMGAGKRAFPQAHQAHQVLAVSHCDGYIEKDEVLLTRFLL